MRIDRSRQSDGLPISTGSTLIIRDSRFSLRYDTASSTYTLQVRGPYTACYYGALLLEHMSKVLILEVLCTVYWTAYFAYIVQTFIEQLLEKPSLWRWTVCPRLLSWNLRGFMLFDLGSKYYNYCCRCTSATNAVCRILLCSGKIWFCVIICEFSYANIALQMLSSFFILWCKVYFP